MGVFTSCGNPESSDPFSIRERAEVEREHAYAQPGVVGPRVRTGRFASHIDFRSARGLSEAEEGHGPEDARTRRTGTRLDRADVRALAVEVSRPVEKKKTHHSRGP